MEWIMIFPAIGIAGLFMLMTGCLLASIGYIENRPKCDFWLKFGVVGFGLMVFFIIATAVLSIFGLLPSQSICETCYWVNNTNASIMVCPR